MKKIKIIALLNKIANGEKVPKKIRYFLYEGNNDIYEYWEEADEYYNGFGFLSVPNHHLNDEVEIIEEYQPSNSKKSKDNVEIEEKNLKMIKINKKKILIFIISYILGVLTSLFLGVMIK